ncbi:unnamed protein product [Caenorhabditis brenneri]
MRILHLTSLCILEIIENWNLMELYSFSLISKRAEVIAKMKKFPTPKKAIISTHEGFSVILEYSESVHWHFKFTEDGRQSENHLDDPCKKNPIKWESRTFFFQDPVQDGLKFADFLFDLFNVSLTDIDMNLSGVKNPDELMRTIEWIDTQKQLEITKTTVIARTKNLLPLVVQMYQKKTKALHIWALFGNEEPDPTVIFSPNLELDELYVPQFSNYGMSLDFLLSSNFPKIDMGGQSMTCQDINTFLNSWKSGITNSKLKYCKLSMFCRIDIRTIFKGLKPIVHDPNTTKIVHRDGYLNRCFYSGIEIQRIDGKRARFNLKTYWLKEGEDAEIHQEVVDEYEDSEELKKDVGNGEVDHRVQHKWYIWFDIE